MPPPNLINNRLQPQPRARRWRCLALAGLLLGAILVSLLALAGCAANRRSAPANESDAGLGWPLPPDDPRIVYLQSFRQPADLGVKTSALRRFARWVVGTDPNGERLVKPFGIALDENDNLCLTDTGANAVCFFDRAKKTWHRWDRLGKLRFVCPVAVAKRREVFYVADSGLARVLAFNESGQLLFQITNKLERPSGLLVSGDRLWVTDSRRHCVVGFDRLGNYVSEFGRRGSAPGEFNFPSHIAADREGNLLVTDSMNSRVQMFDGAGGFKRQIGSAGDTSGHFSRPKGVAADAFGNVYVLDALFDNLQVFDREGRLLLYLGEAGAQPGEFWLANGIAISRDNQIFVTDSYNHRVQVFKYVGPP